MRANTKEFPGNAGDPAVVAKQFIVATGTGKHFSPIAFSSSTGVNGSIN